MALDKDSVVILVLICKSIFECEINFTSIPVFLVSHHNEFFLDIMLVGNLFSHSAGRFGSCLLFDVVDESAMRSKLFSCSLWYLRAKISGI